MTNNIGRTRGRARSEKKHCSLEVSQLFLSETEAMINILNALLQHYAVKNIFVITLFYVTVDQMKWH